MAVTRVNQGEIVEVPFEIIIQNSQYQLRILG